MNFSIEILNAPLRAVQFRPRWRGIQYRGVPRTPGAVSVGKKIWGCNETRTFMCANIAPGGKIRYSSSILPKKHIFFFSQFDRKHSILWRFPFGQLKTRKPSSFVVLFFRSFIVVYWTSFATEKKKSSLLLITQVFLSYKMQMSEICGMGIESICFSDIAQPRSWNRKSTD